MATMITNKLGRKNQQKVQQFSFFADFLNQRVWMLVLLVCWVIVMLTAALLLTIKLAQLDSVNQKLESPLIANEMSVSSDHRGLSKTRLLPGNIRVPRK